MLHLNNCARIRAALGPAALALAVAAGRAPLLDVGRVVVQARVAPIVVVVRRAASRREHVEASGGGTGAITIIAPASQHLSSQHRCAGVGAAMLTLRQVVEWY